MILGWEESWIPNIFNTHTPHPIVKLPIEVRCSDMLFPLLPRKEGGRKKKSFFFMKPIYPLSSYLYALSTHLLYTSFRLHHHIRFSTTTLLIKKSFAFTRVVFLGWMIDFRLSFPFKRYSIYFCRDAKIIKSKTIVDCYISPPLRSISVSEARRRFS